MSIKVKFPNHGQFWLITSDTKIGPETHGALAPLDNCDEHGDILDWETAFFKDSYAHLFEDGIIRRYNKPIGVWSDLIRII